MQALLLSAPRLDEWHLAEIRAHDTSRVTTGTVPN